MVDRMGIVTFFTNLTAAIGFGVFFFTKSVLLKEFGLVAGINIIALFFISLVFIPAFFSFLPPPNVKHTSYLESGWVNKLLTRITNWVFEHRMTIYGFTIIVCALSVWGLTKLRNDAHIVDDLPKEDKVSVDLKFFEKNFKGVKWTRKGLREGSKSWRNGFSKGLKKISAGSLFREKLTKLE
jgi:predicted RND superfamily exporter protein